MSWTILYARASAIDKTVETSARVAPRNRLLDREVMNDNDVSGLSTWPVERPDGRRLFDMVRAGVVLVVRWLDRFGHNDADVVDTIREFMRRGVVIRRT